MQSSEPVLTRVFDAPRERVWKAWTEPEQAKRWHGPKGFTAPFVEIDLRVGGKYLTCMRSPDGKDIWGAGVYREVVPMDRLVFTHTKRNVVPETHYGRIADVPAEELVTLTFEDLGGYSGRIESLVDGEAVHNCPICGELGQCYSSSDNYDSCKWCGSTWRSTGRPGSGPPAATSDALISGA